MVKLFNDSGSSEDYAPEYPARVGGVVRFLVYSFSHWLFGCSISRLVWLYKVAEGNVYWCPFCERRVTLYQTRGELKDSPDE